MILRQRAFVKPAQADRRADDNRESWRRIIEFYEEMVQSPQWAFVEPLLALARQFAATERAERFRAGQSVLTLMISTAPRHGLRPGEPFVSVAAQGAGEEFKLQYWNEVGGRVLDALVCHEDELAGAVDALLARLWDDTVQRGQCPAGSRFW